MATENSAENLQEETTCSICLDFFIDPVMLIDCGHNFCHACITQCWEKANTDVFCPQCRQICSQRTLRPNRQLKNVVEIAKKLNKQAAKEAGGSRCEKHGEARKLFCETGQMPICRESRVHRAHPVAPIREAAQQYKEQIQTQLEFLREKRKRLENLRARESQKHQACQEKAAAERRKIVSKFEQLHQFLVEQEQLLLAQLGELERTIGKNREETVTKLSEEIAHLNSLIREMEAKCQQAASDSLQDIRSTPSRYKKGLFHRAGAVTPKLETRLSKLSEQHLTLRETLRKSQGNVPFSLEKGRGDHQGSSTYSRVQVTLDPHTAHPRVLLSKDRRSVRWAVRRQRLPDNPERFDLQFCVLGCEEFTSGRHCWEVEVGKGRFWAVGVARESVRRKGEIRLNPEEGVWAVQRWLDQFRALTAPGPTPLSLHQVPSRVRVCLDCAKGQVSFLNADTEAPIFTFPPASFAGDRIQPWFWLWEVGSQLRLSHTDGRGRDLPLIMVNDKTHISCFQ
ncbi:zinc finger protein RFP-like [Alligator mississippiensis]|uniref:zinc finger protein RFP-like n=1 Tax=Alligator mississippiensis TaxID=8496 RepID=UPI002877A438|nr:zinc finger protein RFP-like [Alligator mississippiensis]XP_059570825.1 zinc finger protein RFP-like [Alligator mississippiensis]